MSAHPIIGPDDKIKAALARVMENSIEYLNIKCEVADKIAAAAESMAYAVRLTKPEQPAMAHAIGLWLIGLGVRVEGIIGTNEWDLHLSPFRTP